MNLSELFQTLQQHAIDQYGGASWWPEYQQAVAGGKDALAEWMNTRAPLYPDWTPDAAAFASKELAMQQDHTRNLFGVNVDQSKADKIGHVAGIGGKIGAAAGAIGAAYLGAGALGAAGAGAEGGVAGGAGAAGAGAGAVDAGVYGLSGIESAAAPGFTYGGASAAAGASAIPTLASQLGASMPAAVPEIDPSFANQLLQTGPGQFENLAEFPGTFGMPETLPTMGPALPNPANVSRTLQNGSALSRILNGTGTMADYLSLGGNVLATGLGIYGANRQQNAFQNQYDQYLGLGAPSRARYEASFSPNFKLSDIPGYQDALNTTTDTLLRRASTGGNPAGNPGVLAEINRYVAGNLALPTLEQYRNQNAATGGYGAFNSAAPSLGTASINAGAGALNAAGYGINQLTNPMPTLDQLFQQNKQPQSLV